MNLSLLALAPLLGFLCSGQAYAEAMHVCESQMAQSARESGVPLNVLYAVGMTETGSKSGFNPNDMNVDGRSLHPSNLADALTTFRAELSSGAKFIDIGCMQINYQWHARDFKSVEDMFNPASNVSYAAMFLKKLRQEQGSWTLAVARYNAGPNNDVAQKKYVCQVLSNMVASGLGRWTPAASEFCK